jgi:hypothetical protein
MRIAPRRAGLAFSAAVLAACLIAGAAAARADGSGVAATCRLIEDAAAANRLPVDLLTRLIWIESRFQSAVTSPAGAEGIAQFMPATAAEQGLGDPYDPAQSIPHAARLLADLERRFGNLGLAAASYNAGAARVAKWLQSGGGLPLETQLYVRAVTGHPVEDWTGAGVRDAAVAQSQSCAALIAELSRREQRAVPAASIWQVRLDNGLSRAIALLAALPAATAARPVAVAPRELRPGAEALCDTVRALGAACAVDER